MIAPGVRGGPGRGYNSSMVLPLTPTLMIKLLFWILAWCVFMRLMARDWLAFGARERQLVWAMLLGAFAGSKLVHALTYPTLTYGLLLPDGDRWVGLLAGDSGPGAVLGGRVALWLSERKTGAAREADLMIRPVAVSLLLLSIATSFWALRGQTYGVPTTLPWGIDFGDGVARHPVMLYHAAYLALALWMHARMSRAGLRDGEAAMLFVIGYSAICLLFGFLKPPFHPALLTEWMQPRAKVYGLVMTGEQWVCLLAIVVTLPGWVAAVGRLWRAR